MKKKLFTLLTATWLLLSTSMNAQTLSVQPIVAQTGGQMEVVVNLTGATTMTALQFNLQLPVGVTATAGSTTLGAVTDGHTLSVETLDSGDLLFILYSMDLKAFKDGELLRIPVTAGSNELTATGKLYHIRTATAAAFSNLCDNASFNVTVKEPETLKCATPTISLAGGKVHFECATEGVLFHYEFTTPESGNGTGNDVAVTPTYVVKVYASKAGYADSEIATANINVAGLKGDVNDDGVVDIADAVKIVNFVVGKVDALSREQKVKD